MMRRLIQTSILFLAVILVGTGYGEKRTIEDDNLVISYEAPLQNAASEIIRLYPDIRTELAKDLGWRTDFRPEIILRKDTASFRRMGESDLIVARALPKEDIIVIDYSKMNVQPFTLGTTLKHELCHLELHHHIAEVPRWFDEGICQWVTGGLSEIMNVGTRSTLREAALSNRLISFDSLTEGFPSDGRRLDLAYQESSSMIDFIKEEFGVSGVRNILEHMNKGDDLDGAIQKSLSITLDDLEKRWRASIASKTSWFSYVGDNLYEILFAFAALITVYGFFRVLKKKREYKDEEEDDGGDT